MYAREVADNQGNVQQLTFIVSGKLWRNSLIMQDRQTGSLWSHITGECLEGAYQGTVLSMLPVAQTTWGDWVAAHPETRVLEKSAEIKSSRYESYFQDPERNGLFASKWLRDRLPGKSLVHGVTLGAYSVAVVDTRLIVGEPVTITLGEVPLKVIRHRDGGVRATRLDTGEPVPVRTSYWFAWSAYFPRTEVLD